MLIGDLEVRYLPPKPPGRSHGW